MKSSVAIGCVKTFFLILFLLFSVTFYAQVDSIPKAKSAFWKHVQFGGGFGLGIGNGFTNIATAPSSIYNFNQYVSVGVGIQYSYLQQRNLFSSHMYGGSILGLINPIPQIQLSVELEQLRVNVSFEDINETDNFWNTGLFLGAGYRTNNVTIGGRYNLLFNKNKNVYGEAFMPFVRVFF
jgi:hypothetical protein